MRTPFLPTLLTVLATGLGAPFGAPLAAQTPDSVPPRPVRVDTAPAVARDSAGAAPPAAEKPAVKAPEPRRPLTAEQVAAARRDSLLDLRWPVKGPDPLPGAILPAKRVIAFYGNPLSKRMGVLGEYPSDSMLKLLDSEVKAWEEADPETPVQPALHLIAVVAQGAPGRDGKYRLRMADTLIERVASWAETRGAIVFLDVQVGHSTLQEELPKLASFLVRPNFHLGIDPEFSMKNGGLPGERIGTYDATDVNYAAKFLADLVENHKLPPKILVVHRFTQRGLTNYERIVLRPEVQIVMHMDGFGSPVLKRNTFRQYIKSEPVQFVGWKQFYKAKNDHPRTTIAEILQLRPKVLYIQYQ